jgi:hypothetical protein
MIRTAKEPKEGKSLLFVNKKKQKNFVRMRCAAGAPAIPRIERR